jgi:hypothetical protein
MIIQVQQLITFALQDIGSIAKQETPTSDEMADGLTKLNFMIDAWAVRSLMVLGTILQAFPLVPGQSAYTIGTGGNFNTPRPSAVTDAFIRDGNGSDTPVDILTSDEWYALEDKAIATGRPQGLWFDPGLTQQATGPLGTVNLYPAPDPSTPYTLYLGEQGPLTEFASLTSNVTFQPAYYEALEYNLAVRLWPQYHDSGKPIENDLKELAKDAMRVIETMNAKMVTATIEAPTTKPTGYNIYTGGYSQ